MSLEISPDEFWRVAGYVLGMAKDYLGELDSLPSFPPDASGQELLEEFAEPLPQEGGGDSALAALLSVLRYSRPPSPRFYGYVLGSGDPVAACADLLASVLNQNVTAWRSSPAAVTIERMVVGWLAEAIGCRGFVGSLTGGGSSANTMALAMARESRLPANDDGAQPAVVYASEEVHMSIPKAVALLGIGRSNLRLIPTDENFRMRADDLEKQFEEDKRAGKKAIAVVASAGTVNTGAVDPLTDVADICRRHNLWLHVDGAYGALAAIAAPEKFTGLASADSISLDPHKWLYQPLDCGCLLFRDRQHAHTAFAHSGDYARALSRDPVEGFAFFEESIELSRRFRALKIWLSLRYHGLNAFREAISADLAHAQQLAALVSEAKQLELLAPVPLSAVCFRYVGNGSSSSTKAIPGTSPQRDEQAADSSMWHGSSTGEENVWHASSSRVVADDQRLNELNERILKRVIARGRVYISNATIRGHFALRACFVNHRTKEEDVRAVVEEVLAAAADVEGE